MLGIPIFALWVLYRNRESLLEPEFFSKYGFLIARFKVEYYYWEVFLLGRLAVLTLVLLLLGHDVAVQTMAGSAVLLIAQVAQTSKKPFLSSRLNDLETFTLVASCLTLFSGQVFYNGTKLAGMRTVLTVIVLLLLCANLFAVAWVIVLEIRGGSDKELQMGEHKQVSCAVCGVCVMRRVLCLRSCLAPLPFLHPQATIHHMMTCLALPVVAHAVLIPLCFQLETMTLN